MEASGAPGHNLVDSAVNFEIIEKPLFLLYCFHASGFPGMSLGGSEEVLGHNGGLLSDNEDVLGALLDVNQSSFKHLECLLGAPGAQGKAQRPQNGVGEVRAPRPSKKGMPKSKNHCSYIVIYIYILKQ